MKHICWYVWTSPELVLIHKLQCVSQPAYADLAYGVPQGPVLGPLPLGDVPSRLFADDLLVLLV